MRSEITGSVRYLDSGFVYPGQVQEILRRVLFSRRDIRHFRKDPLSKNAIFRILEAAHAAPSVGLSQPWNFLLIESVETRKKIKTVFNEINQRESERLKDSPKRPLYDSLKLEGILEAPLNIAVTCQHDSTFVLGHAPMPKTVEYSVCLAIENLWLAARAEGIGVGWVSILNPAAATEVLQLPDNVELIAYLCVGYPVEFREKPLLEEVGWKSREGLQQKVFQENWGREWRLPDHRYPLIEPLQPLQPIEETEWQIAAQKKLDNKTKPQGSLGVLEQVAVRLAVLQKTLSPIITRKRICIYAASHGVTEEGVSAYPHEVTGQMVLNFLNGGAAINVLARQGGIELHIVDVGVDTDLPDVDSPQFFSRKVSRGTHNFLREPAMTPEGCEKALAAGREQVGVAREQGVDVLGIGEMGIGNSTSAAVLFVALCGLSSEEVVGEGTGITEDALKRKREIVDQAFNRYSSGIVGSEGFYWLRMVGGFEIAAMVGTILEAAEHRLPVVVDGYIATAAAVVAIQVQPAVRNICFFSHRSDEQAHGRILRVLNVEPLLDLKMRLGEGTGAALGIPLLEAASKIMVEMATFESAAVSEKTGVTQS